MCVCELCLTDYSWTTVCQAPLSMGFSRQEYWSGLLFHSPEDLPDPGIDVQSLTSPSSAGEFFTTCAAWEAQSDREEFTERGNMISILKDKLGLYEMRIF